MHKVSFVVNGKSHDLELDTRTTLLDALREHGIRYAMLSNADNLGARVDPRIPGHMAAERIPFLMEVVQGTEADRKGGHVARRRADGHGAGDDRPDLRPRARLGRPPSQQP